MNFPRYIRTLRHLRGSQLTGQLRDRLQKRFRDPAKALAKVPSWSLGAAKTGISLSDPVPPQDPSALAGGRFTFIGRAVAFGDPFDWNASGQPRLWQYNLHYFDWLWSLLSETSPDWESASRLVRGWIDSHPPARHAVGWEPYPTSLRLINWALLFGIRHHELTTADLSFRAALLDSVAKQVRWLEENLETHIQANHLLENLACLVCVGSVFTGDDCHWLLARILPSLRREIHEQILGDGVHYERSPMYQLRILWLMEMLVAVGTEEVRRCAEGPAERMRAALGQLRHPDGGIAQLNDAAVGVYHDGWPQCTQPGPWALADAGYYGYRNGRGDYMIADAGAIGPDHQPGHAHADLLSFELSLDGKRVVTDTGIGTYEAGPARAGDRSTAAHSTVQVAGENSVEVWGGFRVGRRVVPEVLSWEPRPEGFILCAEHQGYRHLRCRAVHRRTFEWCDGVLIIVDLVQVARPVPIASRFHLAPGIAARIEGTQVMCEADGHQVVFEIDGPGQIEVERSPAHPTFGANLERNVIVIRHTIAPPAAEWTVRIRR